MVSSTEAARALERLRDNRKALGRFNGEDGWVRADLSDEESASWNRLFHDGAKLMAKAADAGATNAEIALAMGLGTQAVASHLKSRKRRQKRARRARLAIERHGRSRLWRWWYEFSWRALWDDERKDAVRRERGEPVPESPLIEDIWELAEREGHRDDGELRP